MYKAVICFEAIEDDYEQGEIGRSVNSWDETLTAETQSELRNKILKATYSKWVDLDDDQANEYDWCTEYHTSYLADENNEGDASLGQIEQWKKGKLRLYAVNCHILVTETTESKVTL